MKRKHEKKRTGLNAPPVPAREKQTQLGAYRCVPGGGPLTTDQGVPIEHTDDSLKAGIRGPSLLEDFHLREKITRFDHERIPERAVHARGSGAHGTFQVYESMARYTRAAFLQDPEIRTPAFVRFSTVVGSRGSADTVRDVRGFAVKFYTREGNFDLVGNNIPVFFIQDGAKFPDLVHAVKPEPDNEIPQAQSAHDTFWDFVSLVPETAHMVMWAMSDRAIPRSYRMMQGFGVHTFRLVDARGRARLCKFHWKPLLGTHALVWDEAQKLQGKDPDFHRRDLWEAIESGAFPQYELGVQVVDEKDQQAFGFDLLDPTKVLPEEVVPVEPVGLLTLDRNPTNFFAETEQVAFHVGNLVPGIDVTNDPLLQARLFSYLDTQLNRFGTPNFAELPINRPLAAVQNHQQDGPMRSEIPTSRALYHPNSVGGGLPALATPAEGGYVHVPEPLEGEKVRRRSESFLDFFTQARMFLLSLSDPEREHLTDAFRFEVAKVKRRDIRRRVLAMFSQVDEELATRIAEHLGESVDDLTFESRSRPARRDVKPSPALSMLNTAFESVDGRRVAVLAAHGVDGPQVAEICRATLRAKAQYQIVAPQLGPVETTDGSPAEACCTLLTADSVTYDAVVVPGGGSSVATLLASAAAQQFLVDAYRHFKTIGALGEGQELVRAALRHPSAFAADPRADAADAGLLLQDRLDDFAPRFLEAVARHRHWSRRVQVPGDAPATGPRDDPSRPPSPQGGRRPSKEPPRGTRGPSHARSTGTPAKAGRKKSP